MPKLIFTIGLPRSGKSTWATKWAQEQPMRAIVCSDSIRKCITGQRYQPLAETLVFATKHVMIRSLLDRGFDVCVDGTHSTEISVMRILEIDINAEPVLIQTPMSTCIQRAVDTNQRDLIPVIGRIASNLGSIGFYNSSNEKFLGYLDDIKNKIIDRGLYKNE